MARTNNPADMTVVEIINDVRVQICNNYCKYTEEYLSKFEDPDDAFENMLADKCHFCPFNRL